MVVVVLMRATHSAFAAHAALATHSPPSTVLISVNSSHALYRSFSVVSVVSDRVSDGEASHAGSSSSPSPSPSPSCGSRGWARRGRDGGAGTPRLRERGDASHAEPHRARLESRSMTNQRGRQQRLPLCTAPRRRTRPRRRPRTRPRPAGGRPSRSSAGRRTAVAAASQDGDSFVL